MVMLPALNLLKGKTAAVTGGEYSKLLWGGTFAELDAKKGQLG